MKELNVKELLNAFSIFKTDRELKKVRLKYNYFYILKKIMNGSKYTIKDKNVLDKYLYRDIYIIKDSGENWFNHWFILEDNNYVLPIECFEL